MKIRGILNLSSRLIVDLLECLYNKEDTTTKRFVFKKGSPSLPSYEATLVLLGFTGPSYVKKIYLNFSSQSRSVTSILTQSNVMA